MGTSVSSSLPTVPTSPVPTSAPSPCPAQEKSTLTAPCAPSLVGEPPAREAASARTPARETLAAPSCVEASSLVLYPGGTAVPRLDTPESTLRLPTSLTGSTTICKLFISNSQALILLYSCAHL